MPHISKKSLYSIIHGAQIMTDLPQDTIDAILNQSMYHREHERFYAQSPLQQSVKLQQASGILKTLANLWSNVQVQNDPKIRLNPYAGCDDLNEPAAIQHTGVLFLEGSGEPSEISRIKRDLDSLARDCEETGKWLSKAMESIWEAQRPLIQVASLADMLGERHKIIANDWQSAHLQSLISQIIKRALELLQRIDFTPASIRNDLTKTRSYPAYLYSASELLDTAADYFTESAKLVHDNDRKWRIFRDKLKHLASDYDK
jgi:hypothetical protein